MAAPCNLTKSNTPPWVFFTFIELHKWYQIAQSITKENNLLEYVEAVTYGENLLNLYVKNGIIQ